LFDRGNDLTTVPAIVNAANKNKRNRVAPAVSKRMNSSRWLNDGKECFSGLGVGLIAVGGAEGTRRGKRRTAKCGSDGGVTAPLAATRNFCAAAIPYPATCCGDRPRMAITPAVYV